MPPEQGSQLPPKQEDIKPQISLRRLSLYFAVIIIAVFFFEISLSYHKIITEDDELNISLPGTPYAALYACGARISKEIGIFATGPVEALSLTDDLLFALNSETGEIYFYTPEYAGSSEIDLNSESYNFLIPHLSNETVGPGYFYVSTDDHAYASVHDIRTAYLGFIPGEKQPNPDFAQVSKKTLRIGGNSNAPRGVQFQSLPIESQLWSEPGSLDAPSVSMLSEIILDRLPDLHQETHRVCPGAGCPSRSEVNAVGDRVFQEITAQCEDAGRKNNNQEILDAVALARKNAVTNPDDRIPIAVENLIKKAGQPYITLPKESAHADYTSYLSHPSSDLAGIDPSQPDLYAEVADKDSFRELGFVAYAADDQYGYHWAFGMTADGPPVHWEKIPDSDGATFHYLGGPYAADKKNVYFETPYRVSVVSSEPDSFTIVDMQSGITKDAQHVYFADYPIQGADPATAEMIKSGNPYYYGTVKDKNYLYIVMRGAIDISDLYRLPAADASNLPSAED